MKQTLTVALFLFCITGLSAQSLMDKLAGKEEKSNLEFYSEPDGTSTIETIKPGEKTIYVKVPLRSKDFKVPFGKYYAYSEWDELEVTAEVRGLKDGYSVADVRIYYERIQLPANLTEMAKNGEAIAKVELSKDINFESNVADVLEYGNDTYELSIIIGDDKEPLGYGVLKWDLTDGGQAYAAASLATRADYTFGASDDVTDPDFKASVKEDIERRLKVQIYQMAHGDRVPYNRGLNYYRRNQIGVTFKDLEDGKCYTGGISAFEDGSGPNGPYSYDMEGQLSYGDQIPCDRVDK